MILIDEWIFTFNFDGKRFSFIYSLSERDTQSYLIVIDQWVFKVLCMVITVERWFLIKKRS